MDEKLKDILKDFDECGKIKDCEKCKAFEKIEGTNSSYCDLLRYYTNDIFYKIERAFYG